MNDGRVSKDGRSIELHQLQQLPCGHVLPPGHYRGDLSIVSEMTFIPVGQLSVKCLDCEQQIAFTFRI